MTTQCCLAYAAHLLAEGTAAQRCQAQTPKRWCHSGRCRRPCWCCCCGSAPATSRADAGCLALLWRQRTPRPLRWTSSRESTPLALVQGPALTPHRHCCCQRRCGCCAASPPLRCCAEPVVVPLALAPTQAFARRASGSAHCGRRATCPARCGPGSICAGAIRLALDVMNVMNVKILKFTGVQMTCDTGPLRWPRTFGVH